MKHFGRKLMSGFLAIFMSVAMLVGMLPVMGRKAKAADDEIILTFSDPDYSGNILVNSAITNGGKTVVVTGSTSKYNLTIQAEEEEEIIVVLKDVNINMSEIKGKPAILIEGSGAVTIKLEGENTVVSGEACAGIQKDGSGKLTITETEETGRLAATGGFGGAGIGGGHANGGSNITISGGTVHAMGGSSGAGIGGGYLKTGSNITISGGKVTAIGGNGGAGIGGGNSGSGSNIIIGGNAEVNATGKSGGAGIGGGYGSYGSGITIESKKDATAVTKVTAEGGENGAGIGGGYGGDGKNITIQGGEVTSNGGRYGAGIGGGNGGDGSNITITGGTVTANGGDYGAGIGGGDRGSGSGITIGSAENATEITKVTAEGGNNGAGIGGGFRGYGSIISIEGNADVTATGGEGGAGIGGGDEGNGSEITIKGNATVTASGGNGGAGIGGGCDGDGSSITIEGDANVTATGKNGGAGIGGGEEGNGTDITITGGTVEATGGKNGGAGIGGGNDGTGSNIIIFGGTVTATGGVNDGAGIGGGGSGDGSSITIEGDANVTATGGYSGAGIGGGDFGNGSAITINGGTVTAEGGQGAAGIGGGKAKSGSNITISGGTVTATGGDSGAGIGGGYKGDGTEIKISGGDVTATGEAGAGIGGGNEGDGSGITITDGTVIAAAQYGGAGIGGGARSADGKGGIGSNITISGGAVVKAAGGQRIIGVAAAIGQGANDYNNGNESIITVIATIDKKDYTLSGQVLIYPAGTSAEAMKKGTVIGIPVTEAKITFDANGGSGTMNAATIIPGNGNKLPANEFTWKGYFFTGWNTKSDGSGASYGDEAVVTFVGEPTLYAQWQKLYDVTITAESETKVYDGTALTNDGYTVTGLAPGDTLESVTVTGSQSLVGYSKNVPGGATIKNASGDDVTAHYVINYKNGTLTVIDGTDPDEDPVKDDLVVTVKADNAVYAPSSEITFQITATNIYGEPKTITLWAMDGVSITQSTFENVDPGETVTTTESYKLTEADALKGEFVNSIVARIEDLKKQASVTVSIKDKFTVAFVDEDGTELQSGEYAYGDMPKYNGEIPSGAPDVVCSAEFSGWDKKVVTVMGDEIYTATYKKYNEHDYQPVDGTAVAPTCTKAGKEADQKCSRCGDVITGKEIAATGHTFDQEVVDAKYLKSAADCISAAVYYKSCKCGEKSTDEKDIFTSGEPAGHKWKAATGYAPKTCEVCGLEEGQKVTYDPIKGQVFVWTKGSKEPFVLTIKRSQDDVNCFLHYLNTLLDGAEIKVEARSGSTIITIPAETLEKLAVGEHKITVVFDDWKADFALSIAEAVATPTPAVDATPVTGDTMPVVPIAVVMVVAFGAAGIAMRRKARMNRM